MYHCNIIPMYTFNKPTNEKKIMIISVRLSTNTFEITGPSVLIAVRYYCCFEVRTNEKVIGA